MTSQQAEDVCLTRLKSQISDRQVEKFPDVPAKYHLLHSVGAMLVQVMDSSFSASVTSEVVSQNRDIQVFVRVLNKNLRTNAGALDDCERVAAALMGLNITKYNGSRFGRIIINKIRFVNYDDAEGLWEYDVILTLPSDQDQNEDLISYEPE